MHFEDLDIKKDILKALKELGFEVPTPIQVQAIPHLKMGKDIIGQAQTGTGKTAAFGIPMIERVNPKNKAVQILIMAPTRELSVQVADEIQKFSNHVIGVKTLAIYGGQPISTQIKALKRGVQIIVGTPGRILDHINRKTLKLGEVIGVVLDEADQMLDMGFQEDMEAILKETPTERQTAMFSATISREIERIAQKYMKQPEKIMVAQKALTVPQISQYYFEVKPHEKVEALCRILDMDKTDLGIIFCRTKRSVDELTEKLQNRGYSAAAIHGDLKQTQRDRVMKKFRNRTIDLLVATDVAARGIDVNDVEMVMNYDIPEDFEYYVHRIGRTGRAGKEGVAYTLATGKQMRTLKALESYIKGKIVRRKIPTVNDVVEKQKDSIADQIHAVIEKGGLTEYTNFVEKLSDDHNSMDIAAALFKMLTEKSDTELFKVAENISDTEKEYKADMVRLFINIGKSHGVKPKDILGAVAGEAGISGDVVGIIDMYDKFTFVEVPGQFEEQVLDAMDKNRIKGKKINMERANDKR